MANQKKLMYFVTMYRAGKIDIYYRSTEVERNQFYIMLKDMYPAAKFTKGVEEINVSKFKELQK